MAEPATTDFFPILDIQPEEILDDESPSPKARHSARWTSTMRALSPWWH